jgi:hypothetical protein
MAIRAPLVLNAGQIQQLQSSDTLNVPIYSGGDVIVQTNSSGSPIVCGTPVYTSSADNVAPAEANAVGTTFVMGLVQATSIAGSASGNIQVNGILTLTTTQWNTAFGTASGLTPGTTYFLSATTAGLGTATAPSTTGQYVTRLGIALSTTELLINISPPILL